MVADTLEEATAGAALVEVQYEEQPPVIETSDALGSLFEPEEIFGPVRVVRGDVAKAIGRRRLPSRRVLYHSDEHHNPMEPSATVAAWEGDDLRF